jgi:predicted metal-dependent enzyme (double-stranded beta helix superfamily)
MFDPASFVRFCQNVLHAPDAIAIIHSELLRIVATPAEIPPPARGKPEAWRIHRSSTLTILHTAYPRSTRTPPHNHGMWAIVSVYRGREDNVTYKRAGTGLSPLDTGSIGVGEAVRLEPEVIHDLSTCAEEPTCSIHVYGGDLYDSSNRSMWVPPSCQESRYDEEEFFRYSREMMRAV